MPRRRGAWSPSIESSISAWPSSGDLDALHRPHGHAAHLHGVALHQLTGVQEARLDLVAAGAAAAEEDQGDQYQGSDQRTDGSYASDSAQRSHLHPCSSRTVPAPSPSHLANLPKPESELSRELLQPVTQRCAGSCAPARARLCSSLFGIWVLLARPGAGGAVEGAPGAVVAWLPSRRGISLPGSRPPAGACPRRRRGALSPGGSSSSIRPQTWSKVFLPTKPARSPAPTDTGMNSTFAMPAVYPTGVAVMSAALGQVRRLEGHREAPRREAAPHTPPAHHAARPCLGISPDDAARDPAAEDARRECPPDRR